MDSQLTTQCELKTVLMCCASAVCEHSLVSQLKTVVAEPLPNVTIAFSMLTKDRTHRASPQYTVVTV